MEYELILRSSVLNPENTVCRTEPVMDGLCPSQYCEGFFRSHQARETLFLFKLYL